MSQIINYHHLYFSKQKTDVSVTICLSEYHTIVTLGSFYLSMKKYIGKVSDTLNMLDTISIDWVFLYRNAVPLYAQIDVM